MSIITPSFNMGSYLKRCCASVADQQGPAHEHIVVDGGSTDGSAEWLRCAGHITSIIGKDQGMYDAINKGLAISRGSIISYLSCDEQYLPGTLAHVEHYFAKHPHVDGVFGDTLVTWPDGRLISFQKSYPPIWPLIVTSQLYVFPSSMFLRRTFIDRGELFNPRFKYSGDGELVIRLLRKGYRLRTTRGYLSAFTITGSNRGQESMAQAEERWIAETVPRWVYRQRVGLNIARRMLKLVSGAYFERPPLRYAIYLWDTDAGRVSFEARHLSPRWRIS
jgi:glycosyltransferase involved in cell wall biosynthesis